MLPTLKVKVKKVYGNELVYPVCEHSQLLARLANRKTLTAQDIRIIEEMGYKIEVETPTLAGGK